MKNTFSKNKIIRIIALLMGDIIIINLAAFLAIILRFGLTLNAVPPEAMKSFFLLAPINTLLTLMIFTACKLYRSVWEYIGVYEVVHIFFACVISSGTNFFLALLTQQPIVSRGIFVIEFLLLTSMTMSSRFAYRMIRLIHNDLQAMHTIKKKKIMVIGAGDAGNILIHEQRLVKAKNGTKIVCVIDDNPNKIGSFINGIKVVGDRNTIPENAAKYKVDEIIYAIPSSDPKTRAEILNICKTTPCSLKTIPSISQILDGKVRIENIREVRIEDLLGREAIKMDTEKVMGYVKDKVVLVTGGGGSIGSELCRQIALHDPKHLIIFDIYENNAYDIQNELKRKYGASLNLTTLIGSVRDSKRVNQIFAKYRPNIIFHAAAHKHVPLMEDSPNEAIKNNVFGTVKVSNAAARYHAERFVLISTDKAVNPTNIMGATKRLCEMVVQSANRNSDTEFVAVRFGNVLGSNGSVIPLFKRQIANGGPVTVTDPEIIRYFMTIPEAVSLVLQAGAQAKGGEIFVLDMGAPVKILDLAENLIRLSGHMPYVDIDIKFTGLRPGEKLYEELLMDEEGLQDTENKLIHIGNPIDFDEADFQKALAELNYTMMDDEADIRILVQKIVPTYRPDIKENNIPPENVQSIPNESVLMPAQ